MVEDSSRAPQGEDDPGSLVGTVFETTVVLGAGCDATAPTCEVQHDSFAVYAPEPVRAQMTRTEGVGASASLTMTEEVVDDCVDEAGQVVGDFDTTVTEVLTLTDPVADGDGDGATWTTVDVSYVEDAVSDDTAASCYTSRYRVEGTLTRVP